MAKGNRGGRRGQTPYTVLKQVVQPDDDQQTQPTPQPAPQPQSNPQYDAFMKMNDDQKAQTIVTLMKQGVPDHLNANSSLQRLMYNMGYVQKPTMVDDATLASTPGKDLYRAVNEDYNSAKDLHYTAPEIAQQIFKGSHTMISDDGSAAYGDGLYHAGSYAGCRPYGHTYNNLTKTCVLHGKISPNAKLMSYSNANNAVYREIQSGSKLGKALAACNYSARESVYAFSKGYDGIYDRRADYYSIWNRGVVTYSKTIRTKT